MKPATVQKLRPIFRWVLGLLLLWAAVSKLANPTEFLGSLYAYKLPLPKPALQMVAVILPWVELLCGLLLVVNFWSESALACTAGLFVVFLLATGQAWARQLNISCGCFDLKVFGLHESHPKLVKFLESPGFAFCRNLALISLTIFLLRKKLDELKPEVVVTPKLPGKTGKRPAQARG
jgi:putative oxidoreductase